MEEEREPWWIEGKDRPKHIETKKGNRQGDKK